MLQRYLGTSARLEALRATVDAALTGPPPGGGGGTGSGYNNGNDTNGVGTNALARNGSTPDRKADTGGDITSSGDGGGGDGGSSISSKSKSSGMAGSSVLTAQLDAAAAILSRKLDGLSEGDLLLIWERYLYHEEFNLSP